MNGLSYTQILKTVGLTSSTILGKNGKREALIIQNKGPGTIRLIPGDGPATANDLFVRPNTTFEWFAAPENNIQSISNMAGTAIVIWEGEHIPLPGD